MSEREKEVMTRRATCLGEDVEEGGFADVGDAFEKERWVSAVGGRQRETNLRCRS